MWRQDHQDLIVVGASIIVREQVLKDGNMREARPTIKLFHVCLRDQAG